MNYDQIWNKVNAKVNALGEAREAKLFDLMDENWHAAARFLGVRYNEFTVWMEYDPE